MCDRLPALGERTVEHARELRGRMADLCRVEANSDNALTVRQCLLERRHSGFDATIAEEAHDELGGDALAALALAHSRPQPFDHRLERNAARDVRLRIEKEFGVHNALGARP